MKNQATPFPVVCWNLHGFIRTFLMAVALFPVARAQVQTRAYYRMGETLSAAAPAPDRLASLWSGPELRLQGTASIGDTTAAEAEETLNSSKYLVLKGNGSYRGSAPTRAVDNVGIEAWVRPDKHQHASIVEVGGGGGYGIIVHKDRFRAVVMGKRTIGEHPVKPGEWTHVAFVVEDGKGTLYVNGEAKGSGGFAPWGPKDTMAIGAFQAKDGDLFEGSVDEVRIFEFAHGGFEVKDLNYFSAPTPPIPEADFAERVKSADPDFNFGEHTIGITFEKEPITVGMDFPRKGSTPTHAGGKTAWAAHSIPSGMAWMRKLDLYVEDPAFQHGRMPFVDVEIEYRHNTWGNIVLYADTESGSRRIGSAWGGRPAWQKRSFRIRDAYFGRREHDVDGLSSSGADLRIYGTNQAPEIRSVRIKGYDRVNVTEWETLLEVDKAAHPERSILVFQPGDTREVRFDVRNHALVEKPMDVRYRVSNFRGEAMSTGTGTLTAPPRATTRLIVPLASENWPLGGYVVSVELSETGGGDTLKSFEALIGLANGDPVGKARPGEFLYGMQKVENALTGPDAEWLEFTGADILRAYGGSAPPWKDLRRDAPELLQRGVSVMPIVDVPVPGDFMTYKPEGFAPGEREKAVAKLLDKLIPVVRELKGVVTYWEIHNEPDLKPFYSGPIDDYIESFRTIRAAIKEVDPDAVVMNGGLSYHGEDGQRRSRRVVEALAPDGVDAWAYHAHGPGAQAQRRMHERIHADVAEAGPVIRPFIDTESGVAAREKSQFEMQAATCIQKFTYAQSVDMPLLAWFALNMGHGAVDYTNTVNRTEPRPVMLAFRTIVQQLRHHVFETLVETGDPDVEAYLFGDRDSDRRVVVAWLRNPGVRTLYLDLAERADDIINPAVVDMYGNRESLKPVASGVVRMRLTGKPVFFTWDARDPVYPVKGVPSPLTVPDPVVLASGHEVNIPVTVRNSGSGADAFALEAVVRSERNIRVDTPGNLEISASSVREIRVAVSDSSDTDSLDWPLAWKVFAERSGKLADQNVGEVNGIPDTLAGIVGEWVAGPDGEIDIGSVAGGHRERDAAILMAEIDSSMECTIEIGASADWWMEWYVNGKSVYSTMDHGNRGLFSITTHRITLPLEKGRNLIAVRVLSGSSSWKFVSGGPDSLAAALNPTLPPERIEFRLRDTQGESVAEQVSAITWMRPVKTYDGEKPLHQIPPVASTRSAEVRNFHESHPDAIRWYSGPEDLSGTVWMFRSGDRLRLAIRVRDDALRTDGPGADAVEVMIGGYGEAAKDGLRLTAGGELAPGSLPKPRSSRVHPRADGIDYILDWDSDAFPAGPTRVLITLFDNDDGYLKQEAVFLIDRVLPQHR